MNVKLKYALFDFFVMSILASTSAGLNLVSVHFALTFVVIMQILLFSLNCYSYLIRFLDLTTATSLFFRISICIVIATGFGFLLFKQVFWNFTFIIFFTLYLWRVLAFYLRNPRKINTGGHFIIFGTEEPHRLMYIYLRQKLDAQFHFLDLSEKWIGHKIYGQDIINEAQLRLLGDDVTIVLLEHINSIRQNFDAFAKTWEDKFVTFNSLVQKQTGSVTEFDMSRLLEQLTGREHDNSEDVDIANSIQGKAVLVTGGAGSIGSELVRQLLKNKARAIHILDANEFGIYKLQEELSETHDNVHFHLGDLRDEAFLSDILLKGCDLVFHAAAYKHVPIIEQNHAAAYFNNYVGTKVLLKKCIQHRIEHMVLVSTDKAVRPTNIMGASKRLSELALLSAYHEGEISTKFSIVRFGNVMGSSGSVIPKFKEQISKGGPVTVTHPEIKRYFMTIPEAAKLVLKSHLYTSGKPSLYVLDMGQQLKITDLVNAMIDLFSNERVDIIFTGLRPGEKMYEELVHDGELSKMPDERILVQDLDGLDMGRVNYLLTKIDSMIVRRDFQGIRKCLYDDLINFKEIS